MCVLIVEDEADIRETLEEFLADEGYAVRTAPNGAVALQVLAEPELPCVVLLDLMMPVLDGNEVIERMKRSDRLARVPIVITTSDPSRAPAGIPVLRKPMSLHAILDRVKEHCPRGR
jgi:DNA-binding response OmpR family regulator